MWHHQSSPAWSTHSSPGSRSSVSADSTRASRNPSLGARRRTLQSAPFRSTRSSRSSFMTTCARERIFNVSLSLITRGWSGTRVDGRKIYPRGKISPSGASLARFARSLAREASRVVASHRVSSRSGTRSRVRDRVARARRRTHRFASASADTRRRTFGLSLHENPSFPYTVTTARARCATTRERRARRR